MAHAKFRYADHSHAKILKIDTAKARALPGVVAVVTQADLPDVRLGGFVQDRYLFAKDVVRFEGEIVAGVAALTEEIAAEAARLIEIEYEPLPVVIGLRRGDGARRAAGARRARRATSKDENIVADGNTMAYHTIVKGDADAAMAGAEVVVKSHYVVRRVAGRADRAARGRRAVAGRQGHDLVVDAGAVRRARRRRADARRCPSPTCASSCRCSAAGSARSATCTSRARSPRSRAPPSARSGWSSRARRSSPRSRSAARASSMEFETGVTRDGTLVARRAKLVLDKGAYCGEGGFLGQMAAMHACGPYQIDDDLGRGAT